MTSVANYYYCNIFYMYKIYIMNFISSSVRELKHVVWPTKDETKKYFFTVLLTLILFGLYIFVTGAIFEELLFALKDLVK